MHIINIISRDLKSIVLLISEWLHLIILALIKTLSVLCRYLPWIDIISLVILNGSIWWIYLKTWLNSFCVLNALVSLIQLRYRGISRNVFSVFKRKFPDSLTNFQDVTFYDIILFLSLLVRSKLTSALVDKLRINSLKFIYALFI